MTRFLTGLSNLFCVLVWCSITCLENNHEIVNFIVTKYNTGNAQLSVNSEGQYKENLEKAIGFSELNIAATNDTKIPIGTTIELYGMRW